MISSEIKKEWKAHIKTLLTMQKQDDTEKIFEIFELFLFEHSDTNLTQLYKLLGLSTFSKVINLFSGRTVDFPNLEDFEENLRFALVYYYREHQRYTWPRIDKLVPFEVNTKKYGQKIKNYNTRLKEKVKHLMEEV